MSRALRVGVVATLATILLVYVAVERGTRIRAREVLEQLPETAHAVLHVEIEALERSPAAALLFEALVPREQLTEIEAVCGITPLTALRDITLWIRGPQDEPFQSVGLLVRGGSADAARLVDCHRALVESRGGTLVRLDFPSGSLLSTRDRTSALAVLDSRSVVTGSAPTVLEALRVRTGSTPALVRRASVASLWPRVSRHATVAALLEPPPHWKEALQDAPLLDDWSTMIGSLGILGLSIRAGSDRMVEAFVELGDREAARRGARSIEAWLHDPPDAIEAPWRDVARTATLEVDDTMAVIRIDLQALRSDP